MFTMTLRAAKAGFFDRAKVMNALSKAERKVFSKAGAYVRQRAKSSLRYRRRPSAAGTPPSVHRSFMRKRTNKRTGATISRPASPLKELIYFSWDHFTRTTVIGPIVFNSKTGLSGPRVLRTLEYGGPSTVVRHRGRTVRVTIKARPFMRPALAAELPNIPRLWRDALKTP